MLLLGDFFPNFTANSTIGELDFHNYLGDSWGILFSHPSDFTPVCTTELARVLKLMPEFQKRNTKVIGLSCDSIESHVDWCKDIQFFAGCNEDEKFPYPIVEDKNREIAKKLCMVDKDEVDVSGIPLTARALFIVDPNKKFRLSFLYPATTGRNFDRKLLDMGLRQVSPLRNCPVRHASIAFPRFSPGENRTMGLPCSGFQRCVFRCAVATPEPFDPIDHIFNYSEILRVLDSLQLTDSAKIATPVDWKVGDDCMVLPTVPEDQIPKVFPQGTTVVPMPSGKNYLRKTKCPKLVTP